MIKNKFKFGIIDSTNIADDSVVFTFGYLNSKASLLTAYYEQLKIPYFGFNWDALADCLGGLEWIQQRNIYLVHDELPHLSKKDLLTYLEILYDTVCLWEQPADLSRIIPSMLDEAIEHRVIVYFPLKNRVEVQSLFQEMKSVYMS